jgi:PilZ domain
MNSQQTHFVAKRFSTKELAQIEVYGRIGKILAKMGNLSTSGAFFEVINSNYMPKNGDLVRMTVNLRSIKRVHTLDAEVVWCKGLGIGLRFLPADKVRDKLTEKTSQDSLSRTKV